jgi:hypothetical protein
MIELGERRWNDILTGENRRTRRKTCPGASLSTTNTTWIDPGANPGLRHERPVTNDLSHGTALDWTYRRTSCCVIKLCWQSNRHKTIVIKTAYTAVLHKRFQPHAVIIGCTFSPCKTCFTKGKSWTSVSSNSNKGKVKSCRVSQHSLQPYFSIINCHSLLLIND